MSRAHRVHSDCNNPQRASNKQSPSGVQSVRCTVRRRSWTDSTIDRGDWNQQHALEMYTKRTGTELTNLVVLTAKKVFCIGLCLLPNAQRRYDPWLKRAPQKQRRYSFPAWCLHLTDTKYQPGYWQAESDESGRVNWFNRSWHRVLIPTDALWILKRLLTFWRAKDVISPIVKI